MVILLEIPVELAIFHLSTWKSMKKLESRVRVGFPEGCKSVVFSKVLGRIFPPLAGFLPKYPILVIMLWFSPHFMKMVSFPPFSAPWGGNRALAAPEREHQRNQCFSYAFLGVLGRKSAFLSGFPPKTPFRVLFGWNSLKWLKFRGIIKFHHFHQIFYFWVFPAARGRRRAWNLHVL